MGKGIVLTESELRESPTGSEFAPVEPKMRAVRASLCYSLKESPGMTCAN